MATVGTSRPRRTPAIARAGRARRDASRSPHKPGRASSPAVTGRPRGRTIADVIAAMRVFRHRKPPRLRDAVDPRPPSTKPAAVAQAMVAVQPAIGSERRSSTAR